MGATMQGFVRAAAKEKTRVVIDQETRLISLDDQVLVDDAAAGMVI